MIFRKLILLFFIQISFAQEIDKNLILDSVESEINGTEPGLILNLFSEKNNLNFSYAYGINDLAVANFLENDSQFRIASVTKTFVAATVLRLWEEKKLELDDPISYHIERNIYDYLIDGGYNPEIITVRNLLNHSAGLFDHTTHPNFFKKLFENAIKEGFLTVAHAGEEGPPEYIWDSLNLLKVRRIDHGVQCLKDDDLVKSLKEKKIPLTVCPLSNVKLCVFDKLENHNLKKMLDKGLTVMVNSDDPAYFGGYLNTNLIETSKALNLSIEDIKVLIQNSSKSSFLDEKSKNNWLEKI